MITLSISKSCHEAWSGFNSSIQDFKVNGKFLHAGLLSLMLVALTNSAFTQPIPKHLGIKAMVVIGRVTSSEDGEVMAGVNIYLKGTQIGTATGGDGQFEFPQKLNAGDVLIFSFVGFVTQEITITEQTTNLNVVMVFDSISAFGDLASDQHFVAEQPKGIKRLFRRAKSGI